MPTISLTRELYFTTTTVLDWMDVFTRPQYKHIIGSPADMPLVSDTLPHYLQQSINDPSFDLMSREEILRTIPIHKLTYK